MRRLLIAIAVIEVSAGAALLGFPSATVSLLFGSSLTPPSMAPVRLVAAALLALGIANWLASRRAQGRGARVVVAAMTAYNFGAALALGVVGIVAWPGGLVLWPAVALHTVMTVWCVVSLLGLKTLISENDK